MEMNWISTDDRLPVMDTSVQHLAVVWNTRTNNRFVTMLIYDEDGWNHDEYGTLHYTQKVTHWMPLPKLPEVDA